jgi:galactokinase
VSEPAEQKALLTRLEHFLVEDQEVLPAAGDALQRGDLASFGQLVDRSQWGSEHLLGNQVPETVGLAAAARHEGALAASAFGAGFGGSVWALIKTHGAQSFLEQWAAACRREFPARAESAIFFLAGAGPAAFQLC